MNSYSSRKGQLSGQLRNKKSSVPTDYQSYNELYCCRGRTRTSTRRLANEQCCCGQPQSPGSLQTALSFVYPVTLTPETRGHVCQDFITPQCVLRTTVQY